MLAHKKIVMASLSFIESFILAITRQILRKGCINCIPFKVFYSSFLWYDTKKEVKSGSIFTMQAYQSRVKTFSLICYVVGYKTVSAYLTTFLHLLATPQRKLRLTPTIPVTRTPEKTQHCPYRTSVILLSFHCLRIFTLPLHDVGFFPSSYSPSHRP